MSSLNLVTDYTSIVIRNQMKQLETLDEKLAFLTEIFCLTEDLRHELSWPSSGQEMEKGRCDLVRDDTERETSQADPGVSEPVN